VRQIANALAASSGVSSRWGMTIGQHHAFRVTRNADLALEEDEADDLLVAIEMELRRRRFGKALRLEDGPD
jgi:polyphosphate kinase